MAFDRNRYLALFRNVARFNGCDPNIVVPQTGGFLPHYPKLRQNVAKFGEAADSIYAMESIQAMLRSRDVRPDFIDLENEILREARSEWWMARCRGVKHIPGWSGIHDQFTMWGIGFGAGVIEVVKTFDEVLNVNYVDHRHIEGFNFLCDPFATAPRYMKWGAAACYIPVDEFEALYPNFKNYNIVKIDGVDKDESYQTQAVRVIRYYLNSTFAVIHDDINGQEIERRENPYKRVMYAVMTHMVMPGAQYGTGKVDLMMPLQETRNKVRKMYMKQINNPAFRVISQGFLSEETVTDLNDETKERESVYIAERALNRDDVASVDFPPMPLDPAVERAMQEMERAFNPAGSTTDFALGRGDNNIDTATEAGFVEESASSQRSLIDASYASAMEDLIQLTFHCAKMVDELEVPVRVKGARIVINDPDEEDLSAEALFEDESQVVLSREGMFASDQDRKKRSRIQDLTGLIQLAMGSGLDATPLLEELFELQGFDFSRIQQAQMNAAQSGPMPMDQQQVLA
jgi:hypothetical protein